MKWLLRGKKRAGYLVMQCLGFGCQDGGTQELNFFIADTRHLKPDT